MVRLVRAFGDYVRADWTSHPVRVVAECGSWVATTIGAITFALTVPHPPFIALYVLWLGATLCGALCAYSRGSVGMVALNGTMFVIDIVGLARLLLQ